MKHVIQSSIIAFGFLTLSACGFSPVHSGAPSYSASSNIVVPEIGGREGHELRKARIEELATGLPGIETATLTISLSDRLARVPLRPDATAARTDINVSSRYVLDIGDDAISGSQTAQSSFNVPVSVFGDIAAQQAATSRIMNVLARRIVDDLKLQLRNREP